MKMRKGLVRSVRPLSFRVALVLLSFVGFAVGSSLFLRPTSSASARFHTSDLQAGPINEEPKPQTPSSQSPSSPEGLWQFVDKTSLKKDEKIAAENAATQVYRAARLDRDALIVLLRQVPMEFTDSAKTNQPVMSLPMPDGTFARFSVEESPIMESGLADQFPEIKTYKGQGVDDPTATARFDWMPSGLHAIVLSSQGTSFVEPFSEDDAVNYISYFNHDVSTEKLSLSCLLSPSEISELSAQDMRVNLSKELANFVTGTTLRTYRLAVAATAEFTQQYGAGNVATTLMKITTLVNQINAVYQKEATITFQLVANETSIIFTDAAADGYTNGTPSTMLAENQAKLDAVIGSANYDVGHVFGGITVSPGFVSFSGVASIGIACSSGSKGRGVSTMGGASGSFPHSIFVSGVTHELAHEFSAPHTFNSSTSGCSGQRSASGAYEPGSGSTIMGYSICGSDNIQNLPDLYFHTGSLEKILSYAAGSGACAMTTPTAQNPPTISALSNFTIPANTPFTLTGSASDSDGDTLTYSWEEFDLGNASPPNSDDGTRPLFRSFPPSNSPSRTFPSLQYILNNANVPPSGYACGSSTCFTGQVLPSTTRTMNFRFTARDNRASGGGSANAGLQINVVSTAGPFAVTQPNTSVSWAGGASQTVMWNVAATTGAPINVANVKISLSTDGGTTFPTVLAASTANDGSESVVFPSVSTTLARVKVEAVGNIFFDISDTNFTISSSGISATVQTNPVGRSFTVDGTTYSSSQTFSWASGSSHTIGTTTPQSGAAGTRYLWANWSDGGAVSHTVAPTGATTYTANFSTQFFLTMNAGAGGTVTPASNWFNSGQDVTITAVPNSGFIFGGWTGVGSISFTGTTNPSSVTMNGPITETAAFAANTGHNTRFDFDGDGKTDLGYYRNGLWPILKSGQSFSFGSAEFFSWGGAELQPIVGDFDGDSKADIGYVVPPSGGQSGAYAILLSSRGYSFAAGQPLFVAAGYPSLGDTPVVGDFDGDGKADPGIWRASQGVWIIPRSSANYGSFIYAQWGQNGDTPIVADIDGDGKADLGFYRAGLWGFLKSSQGYSLAAAQFFSWGGAGLAPIVADFDGDGKADLAYVAPPSGGQSAVYSILRSSNGYGFGAGQVLFVAAGYPSLGDTPVVGDFDGDGKADPAIWRASQGAWIVPLSSGNYSTFIFTQWGQNTDTPMPTPLSQN